MPAPVVLWDEAAALDAVAAMVRAACPELKAEDVYRSRPAATPRAMPRAVLLHPLTPIPSTPGSPFGGERTFAQRQRWTVAVTTAAAGAWQVTVLGQAAPYLAGGGDDMATIAASLRVALDLLGLPVTTAALAVPPAAFEVLGDVEGTSLGVSVQAPAGGAYALAVVDDNVRRAVYNFGLWTCRLVFRDVPSSVAAPATGHRYLAAVLAERVRMWLQARDLPVVNGQAFPYWKDTLGAAPARLSWRQTRGPLSLDEVDGGVWTRAVALDVDFDTPVGMFHDVPSLDALGLGTLQVSE